MIFGVHETALNLNSSVATFVVGAWNSPEGFIVETKPSLTLRVVAQLSGVAEFYVQAARDVVQSHGWSIDDFDGEFVISHESILKRPPRSNGHAVWDFDLAAWVDPRALTDLRAEAWTRIKQSRDAEEFAPFTYAGNTFDGDATAQRRLASLISLSKSALSAGEPFSYPWKTAHNQMVMLIAQDFVAMEMAKIQQFGAAFLKAETLRGQIEAAETTEQLDAIQW